MHNPHLRQAGYLKINMRMSQQMARVGLATISQYCTSSMFILLMRGRGHNSNDSKSSVAVCSPTLRRTCYSSRWQNLQMGFWTLWCRRRYALLPPHSSTYVSLTKVIAKLGRRHGVPCSELWTAQKTGHSFGWIPYVFTFPEQLWSSY